LVGTTNDAVVSLEEQLGALEELRQAGKLDLIGLSNVDQAQVQRGLELVDVAEIQNLYNLLDRRDDELIAFASEGQIAFVPFCPLAGGPVQLARRATIVQIAGKHGATPPQIALAWLLARYERMLLIPGTSSVTHLEENMGAIEIELDDADLAALDGVSLSAAE
jgi:pyridoxine 4-dehydrogenase